MVEPTIFGLSQENLVKVVLGILGIFGSGYGVWIWGGKHAARVAERKQKAEAEALRRAAETADKKADTETFAAGLTGGQAALKTLIDGAANYQSLLGDLRKQAEEIQNLRRDFMDAELAHRTEVGDLRLNYEREINGLRAQVTELTHNLDNLRRENEAKDRALAECGEVREAKFAAEREVERLRFEVENLTRSNAGFLYLFESATTKAKTDPGTVHVAEAAILRILDSAAKVRARSNDIEGAAAQVAVDAWEGKGTPTVPVELAEPPEPSAPREEEAAGLDEPPPDERRPA